MSGCQPTNTDPCYCDCHKPWGSVIPPTCTCNCSNRKFFEKTPKEAFIACKHSTPLLFECSLCTKEEEREEATSSMVQQIQELEERIKNLENSEIQHFKNYKSWIEELEEEIKQINDWIFDKQEKIYYLEKENDMRKDTIGCVDRAYDEECEKLEKRIDKLELFKEEYFDQFNITNKFIQEIEKTALDSVKIISSLIDRINQLEDHKNRQIDENRKISRCVDELVDKIAEIANFYYKEKKTPHKCPVCEGNSKIQVMYAMVEPFEKRIIDSQGRHFILCHTCDGKGIVWG